MEYSPKKMIDKMNENNFGFKKKFGQNFIIDENIINGICSKVDIDNETLVIEIGPGAGSLTNGLAKYAKNVLCYEIDTTLENMLQDNLKEYNNIEIIFKDFLQANVLDDIKKYSYNKLYVVANLPYYITTPIITKLMKEIYPDKIVIMIQDEVANRLSAKEGSKDYGMISVLLSSKYDIKKLFKVSRKCFIPEPNVDSAVISLTKHDKYNIKDSDIFEKLIKDCFQYKRKNLRNNLKGYDLSIIEDVLSM
ncbi:MAG: 16S rRNA (adenine(1518)-N(6)/adenine(1519)-N(6))-dimethyltransferase RsmA, partial [Bacilli bacterium]|nr:16S rRNA (adenine(1518)-N(6)/adenine(1519)-N(6))-dimethyltransferase RsmA [Bacilli bacterium]